MSACTHCSDPIAPGDKRHALGVELVHAGCLDDALERWPWLQTFNGTPVTAAHGRVRELEELCERAAVDLALAGVPDDGTHPLSETLLRLRMAVR